MMVEVKTEIQNGIGVITLQRGNSLNALSFQMLYTIHQTLQQWKNDAAVNIVLIQSIDAKAFSAGGDIKSVYDALKKQDEDFIKNFYRIAYDLIPLIRSYPKPYIALVNGIAMGGGLGLAMHCPYRVIAEDAIWAMPETHIGFYPDVGASIFLKNCPGAMGLFIAMTAYKMNTADALYGKLATHYIPKEYFPILLQALIQLDTTYYGAEIVGELLEHFAVPTVPMESLIRENHLIIDQSSESKSYQEYFDFWDQFPKGWARGIGQNLEYASPYSLAVTFQLFTILNRTKSFFELIEFEHILSEKMVQYPDFQEGVRALLIDKTHHPKWKVPLSEENLTNIFI